MTLMLETLSHGEVESGFFGPYTNFSRLGEYSFATRHLCDLTRFLAENPQVRETQILGYGVDKFWQRMSEHYEDIIQMSTEADKSFLPHLHQMEMERQLDENQGKISLEDEIDMNGEGQMVPIIYHEDRDSINVGQYEIDSGHFCRMAVYLARGGLLGWRKGTEPDFSKPTIEAVKKSNHPLFKRFNQEYWK